MRSIFTRSAALAAALCMAAALFAAPVVAESGKKTVDVTYRSIKIKLGSEYFTPRDSRGAPVEPFILNGSVYLPLRAVAEATNCSVGWNDGTNRVDITTQQGSGGSACLDLIHDLDGTVNNGTDFNNIDPLKKGETCYIRLAEPDGSGVTRCYTAKITYLDSLTGSAVYTQFPDLANRYGPLPAEMEYAALKLRFENQKLRSDSGAMWLSAALFCYVTGTFEMQGSQSLEASPGGLPFGELPMGGIAEGYVLLQINKSDTSPYMMYNDVLWFKIR